MSAPPIIDIRRPVHAGLEPRRMQAHLKWPGRTFGAGSRCSERLQNTSVRYLGWVRASKGGRRPPRALGFPPFRWHYFREEVPDGSRTRGSRVLRGWAPWVNRDGTGVRRARPRGVSSSRCGRTGSASVRRQRLRSPAAAVAWRVRVRTDKTTGSPCRRGLPMHPIAGRSAFRTMPTSTARSVRSSSQSIESSAKLRFGKAD
jgi:hypothetical protein